MEADCKPFRVLALDGGGIRGLYSAIVLESLAKQFAARRGVERLDIGAGFDLIAGTSTGAILAIGLAYGLDISEVIDLFRSVGPRLFRRPIPDSRLRFLKWMAWSAHKPANSDETLRSALVEKFGDSTLEALYRRRSIALCVPAVNVCTGRSWVFKTPHSPNLTRDRNFRLVDVCLSTSAAPIYLPLAAIQNPEDRAHDFVLADGGLWANNPVLVGLIEALSVSAKQQPIQILSISTCPLAQGAVVSKRTRNWGLLKWKAGTGALNLALEAQAWGHHYMAFQLAGVLRDLGRDCHVVRLPHTAPALEQARLIGLDRASQKSLNVLAELARQDGDIEQHFAESGDLQILSDIFSGMKPARPADAGAPGDRDKRRVQRIPRSIQVDVGLELLDETVFGAGFKSYGVAPHLGAQFACRIGEVPCLGTVQWVRVLDENVCVFGVAKQHTGVSAESRSVGTSTGTP